MRIAIEIWVDPATDCDGDLCGAWAAYPNGNRVDAWGLMDASQREQAVLAFLEAKESESDLRHASVLAAREDAVQARREARRAINAPVRD